MIHTDTIKLLDECNAGIKMGVQSIDEALPAVQSSGLRNLLTECKSAHEKLGNETHQLLNDFGRETKEPNMIAKGMSWLKTNVTLAVNPADSTVADLMTKGCNMGVKSLSRYLNEYSAADERSKSIAKRLVALEEKLAKDMRGYL
jgi:hypothetical protein